MKYYLRFSLPALILVMAGCPGVSVQLGRRLVTVRLINNADFDVNVQMFIDDDQEIPEDLLVDEGTLIERTLTPGEVDSFTRSCDELQAIIIDDAELLVITGISPDATTGVLRDGDEFGCGDTITFTFDHSELIVDFDIDTAVDEAGQ